MNILQHTQPKLELSWQQTSAGGSGLSWKETGSPRKDTAGWGGGCCEKEQSQDDESEKKEERGKRKKRSAGEGRSGVQRKLEWEAKENGERRGSDTGHVLLM